MLILSYKVFLFVFGTNTISIEKFDSNLLKLGKKSYKNIDINYIGYITIKEIRNYENKS